MNEVNVDDLVADRVCVILHPHDVYEGGFTEGSGAVEGGVRVEESVLLCWGLNTGRICGGKKEELETEPEHPTLYIMNQPFLPPKSALPLVGNKHMLMVHRRYIR